MIILQTIFIYICNLKPIKKLLKCQKQSLGKLADMRAQENYPLLQKQNSIQKPTLLKQ